MFSLGDIVVVEIERKGGPRFLELFDDSKDYSTNENALFTAVVTDVRDDGWSAKIHAEDRIKINTYGRK